MFQAGVEVASGRWRPSLRRDLSKQQRHEHEQKWAAFGHGVRAVHDSWTALRLAVEGHWGGPDSPQKKDGGSVDHVGNSQESQATAMKGELQTFTRLSGLTSSGHRG